MLPAISVDVIVRAVFVWETTAAAHEVDGDSLESVVDVGRDVDIGGPKATI